LSSTGYFDAQRYLSDTRSEVDKLAARREAEHSFLIGQYWQRQYNAGVSAIFGLATSLAIWWWRCVLTQWFRWRARRHTGSNEELLTKFRRDSTIAVGMAMVVVLLLVAAILGVLVLLALGSPP
jgi:hypothetical protein